MPVVVASHLKKSYGSQTVVASRSEAGELGVRAWRGGQWYEEHGLNSYNGLRRSAAKPRLANHHVAQSGSDMFVFKGLEICDARTACGAPARCVPTAPKACDSVFRTLQLEPVEAELPLSCTVGTIEE